MIEEWRIYKDFRNYPNGFLWEVSNFGRVRRNGIIVEPDNDHGYCKINKFWVHRLVAECFIGEIPKGYHVDHIDGDMRNNIVKNLRICTELENHRNPITRKRLSISHSGKNNPSYGKPGTMLGRIYVNNGIKNKGIQPEELDYYLSIGYKKGHIKKK